MSRRINAGLYKKIGAEGELLFFVVAVNVKSRAAIFLPDRLIASPRTILCTHTHTHVHALVSHVGISWRHTADVYTCITTARSGMIRDKRVKTGPQHRCTQTAERPSEGGRGPRHERRSRITSASSPAINCRMRYREIACHR